MNPTAAVRLTTRDKVEDFLDAANAHREHPYRFPAPVLDTPTLSDVRYLANVLAAEALYPGVNQNPRQVSARGRVVIYALKDVLGFWNWNTLRRLAMQRMTRATLIARHEVAA